MNNENDKLIKTEYDFGWKTWGEVPPAYAEMALKYQKGSVLDIGCATCELYVFLKSHGWNDEYHGIDIKKYDNYKYPEGVKLVVGDPLKLELPKVDTVILYNVLEHVDDPLELTKKALEVTNENVLINIPKRNEELWTHGIVEYHQLDKTHKHCGFSKEEIVSLVNLAGGKINSYKEFGEINATIGVDFWNNVIPKLSIYLLERLFSSKSFNQEIWCEIKKD